MDNNIQETQTQPVAVALTSDEKLLAMLSHFSIFLGGIILPIVLYFVQKDKSKFVAFAALQSIFFHLMYFAIIFVLVIFLLIVMVLTGVFSHMSSHNPGAGFFAGMGIFYLGLFGSILLAIGYAVYMGIKAYNGEINKYFIVGEWAYRKVYGG